MDPELIVNNYGKLKLYKTNFTDKTDVSNFKLLVGIAPCDATVTMIQSANKNNLNMYMMLCGCTHFEDVNRYTVVTYESWLHYVEQIMQDTIPDNRDYVFEDVKDAPYYVLRTFEK